ncbi:hypothetical protein EON63_01835 [archaeon]|nr:MAG: hypothetical protein EON63_01835 [archaeon]
MQDTLGKIKTVFKPQEVCVWYGAGMDIHILHYACDINIMICYVFVQLIPESDHKKFVNAVLTYQVRSILQGASHTHSHLHALTAIYSRTYTNTYPNSYACSYAYTYIQHIQFTPYVNFQYLAMHLCGMCMQVDGCVRVWVHLVSCPFTSSYCLYVCPYRGCVGSAHDSWRGGVENLPVAPEEHEERAPTLFRHAAGGYNWVYPDGCLSLGTLWNRYVCIANVVNRV